MNRKVIDALPAAAALLSAVIFLMAGLFIGKGGSALASDVNADLGQLGIVFPQAGPATADPNIGPYLDKYAGQKLTTPAQAKAYADHYVAVHEAEATGGRTYAELSAAALANPADKVLTGQVETAFRAEALRATLLNAHHDAQIAGLARYGALAALTGGLAMLIMSGLGFKNLSRGQTRLQASRRVIPAPATPKVPA